MFIVEWIEKKFSWDGDGLEIAAIIAIMAIMFIYFVISPYFPLCLVYLAKISKCFYQ